MTDFVSRLEQELMAAADRQIAAGEAQTRRPPHRPVFRRRASAAVGLAVLAIVPTALAAAGAWGPLLGDGERAAPQAAADDPPRDQLRALGVLRDAQSDADRQLAAPALRYLTPGVAGVRMKAVRAWRSSVMPGPVVLIPVRQFGLEPQSGDASAPTTGGRASGRNGLCLYAGEADVAAGGGWWCFSTTQLLGGDAVGTIGTSHFGLVPDDVAAIRLQTAGGSFRTIAVTRNFYAYEQGDATATTLQWIGQRGEVLHSTNMPRAAPNREGHVSCDPNVPASQCETLGGEPTPGPAAG